MEVKVGQVWKSNLTEIEYTVKDVYDHHVSVLRPVKSSIDRVAFDGEIFEMIKDVPPQLSDLEIVQKALDKTGRRLTYHHSNGWAVEDESSDMCFRSSGSLLTWAKQTIWVE